MDIFEKSHNLNKVSLAALLISAAVGFAHAEEIPRTPWGDPDLNGVWDFSSATPLQRPAALEGKINFTQKEAEAFLSQADKQLEATLQAIEGEGNDVGVELWIPTDAPLTNDLRTALIVDPPDGKIPALTGQAQIRVENGRALALAPPSGPEDRPVNERCLLGFGTGPPIEGFFGYNSLLQIFQAKNTISIMNEMVNDVRTIHLDDRPHLPAHVRQWKGNSRGFWDGDRLVVETRNYTDKTSFYGSGNNMRLTETFTRTNDSQIEYAYTVNDPESFTAPFSVRYPFRKLTDTLFEYACHEANRSMESMLRAARMTESEGYTE